MKQNKLIFDVGVHLGEDSEFYLAKGFNVIGVEADPELASRVHKKFQEEISCGRYVLIERAIVALDEDGDLPEYVTFYKSDVSVCGTVIPHWAERDKFGGANFKEIRVHTINFEKILRDYGIPYFLKIDIEGVDNECLRGLSAFSDRPDFISVEAENEDERCGNEQIELLTSLGYDRFQLTQQKGSHRGQIVLIELPKLGHGLCQSDGFYYITQVIEEVNSRT